MVNKTTFAEANYEKLQANPKAIKMIQLRREILEMISRTDGRISWTKANLIAKSVVPELGAQTVQNFALGKTVNPSRWTYGPLAQHVRSIKKPKVWIIEGDFTPPAGVKAVLVD